MNLHAAWCRTWVLPLLIAAQVFSLTEAGLLLTAPAARAADEDALTLARRLYTEEKWQDAIAMLTTAIANGKLKPGAPLSEGTELLARCHAQMGDRAGAVETFYKLHKSDPQWKVNRDGLVADVELPAYDEAEARWQRDAQGTPGVKKGHRKWPWIVGAGAPAAGAVVYLLLHKKKQTETEPLPGPPNPPSTQ